MKDYLIKGIDKTGSIRILVASTTNMVEKARITHNTSPTASAALGRTLTAGIIMGSMMKNEEDILTLKISGNGPAGTLFVVAKNNGKVKGEIGNPSADLPSREDGKLDVGNLVGRNGNLTVIMDLGLKEPYIGSSNLVTGEIAEDLANYFYRSEQIPSVVSLGVLVDKDISIKAAGGYIIQLLPAISEEDIVKIENSLKNIKAMSTMIDKGLTPEEIMDEVLKDFEMEVLDKIEIAYECDCNREKIESVLKSLGKEEIEKIIEEDKEAEIICHFCNTKYIFNKGELERLIVNKNKVNSTNGE